jgi:hypothetical protein
VLLQPPPEWLFRAISSGRLRSSHHRRAAVLWNEYLGRVDRALWHYQQAWKLEPQKTDSLEAARNLYASLGDDAMVGKLYMAELEVLGQRACRIARPS